MPWGVLVYLWPVGGLGWLTLCGICTIANMAGQMQQSGGWRDLPLAAGGLSYLGVCSWVALCLAVFAFWPGVGGP